MTIEDKYLGGTCHFLIPLQHKINRYVLNYVDEIIRQLTSVGGTMVEFSLEVEALSDDGFTQQTM